MTTVETKHMNKDGKVAKFEIKKHEVQNEEILVSKTDAHRTKIEPEDPTHGKKQPESPRSDF